jgi:hypothetical protein
MTLNAISSLPINSSLQNDLRYQFSLKLENIEILSILLAAIGKDENCIQGHFYSQNGRQQNRQNFNVL